MATIRPSEISGPLTKITPIAGLNLQAASDTLTALLDAEASKRIDQIRTFRDYYNGRQIPESGLDGEPLPYVNLCYGVVEKQVSPASPSSKREKISTQSSRSSTKRSKRIPETGPSSRTLREREV